MADQLKSLLYAILILFGIILVVSFITYILTYLSNTELSDQNGWRNFRNPFVGMAIITVIVLGIVLVVLSLLGVFDIGLV